MVTRRLLLVHGWNFANYTSTGCTDAWANRSRLVEALSPHFCVSKTNLPGFCGQPDPDRPWTLNDYVLYVANIIRTEGINYVLGYSFGGAIVLKWKMESNDTSVQGFLVSPAIIRRYEHSPMGAGGRLLKAVCPESVRSLLRTIYLTRVVKNPYYSTATPVMRETYRNVVAIDLRHDLITVPDSLTLLYGEHDSATPPALIAEALREAKAKHILCVIPGGGHDIGNSNSSEVAAFVVRNARVR